MRPGSGWPRTGRDRTRPDPPTPSRTRPVDSNPPRASRPTQIEELSPRCREPPAPRNRTIKRPTPWTGLGLREFQRRVCQLATWLSFHGQRAEDDQEGDSDRHIRVGNRRQGRSARILWLRERAWTIRLPLAYFRPPASRKSLACSVVIALCIRFVDLFVMPGSRHGMHIHAFGIRQELSQCFPLSRVASCSVA
jgi:hypothetical protein